MQDDALSAESQESKPRLHMRGIAKSFSATRALRGVELSVNDGEVLALIGENGAGKSTLMKVLSGALKLDAGQMWLSGHPYQPHSPLEARRAGVAMIYQELSLAPHLSVVENLLLGIEPTMGPFIQWGRARAITRRALAQVDLGAIDPTIQVRRLPLAQQQLVEIARAVVMDCRVLVLDEPTSSLARHDIEKLFTLIRRLRSEGMAIVYISHFMEELSEICDRFTVLRDGESVGHGRVADTTEERIVTMMVGREVTDLYPRAAHQPGEVVLNISNLTGMKKPVAASLQLRRGEVLGIAGLVGAGRTELIRAIFGLDAVVSGEVKIGTYSGAATPTQRWQQGVGMISEDRKTEGLALSLSIADNITLPRLEGLGPWRLVRPAKQVEAARPCIESLSIKCNSPSDSVSSLSGGNQQKVAVARLLHADVDVLLLDEPTRGIDVGSKAQIYQLIDRLARGEGSPAARPRAILIVSSYLPELLGVCDRIAVMCRGKLGPARPVTEWDERQLMQAAIGREGGLAA